MTEEEISEKKKKAHGEIVQLPECPNCHRNLLVEQSDIEFCLNSSCGYEKKIDVPNK